MHDIGQLAVRQLADYDARTNGRVFTEGVTLTVEQAYAVQHEVDRLRTSRGEQLAGYKIGCTSPTIRQQLGIDRSIFGRLYANERHVSGGALPSSDFSNLAIEGELAVVLNRTLPLACCDADQILQAIEHLIPVIELHHLVIHSQTHVASELIANNAMQAGIVVPESFGGLPQEKELAIQIYLGKQLVAETPAFDWRELVLASIRDLSGLLARHNLVLESGQTLLTGSLAELIPVPPHTNIVVDTLIHPAVTATVV